MSRAATSDRDIRSAVELVPDRLYFATLRGTPRDTSDSHFFTVEGELVYLAFCSDFGPLHLSHLYRFCKKLNKKLKSTKLAQKRIYFYSSFDSHARANAAYLIGCFLVLYLDFTPEEAYAPFKDVYPSFRPFRDAAFGVSSFHMTLEHCFHAVHKAKHLGWVDFDNFDPDEYEFYEQVENGDFNWIVPGRILAFSGPHATNSIEYGFRLMTPEDYVPIFQKLGIDTVVRLNKKVYDRKRFTDAGLRHFDLYYVDGGLPTEEIIQTFMDAVESTDAAVAVHCKAGLGRTGSCNGVFMMKHYGLTAEETIAWTRICRPGSIIGPQQHFLVEMQATAWRQGELHREKHGLPHPLEGLIDVSERTANDGDAEALTSSLSAHLRDIQRRSHVPNADNTLTLQEASPTADTTAAELTPVRGGTRRSGSSTPPDARVQNLTGRVSLRTQQSGAYRARGAMGSRAELDAARQYSEEVVRLSPQPRKIPEKGIVSEAASPVRLGASRTGETRRSSRSLLGSGSGGASGRSPGRSGYSERLSSGRHSALGSYGRTTTAALPSRATGNTASTTAAGSARSPTRRSASALGSYASSRRAGGSADLASARLRNSPYSSGYRSSDLFSSPYAASQLSSLTRTSQRSRASPASTTAASLRSPSTAGTTASTRSSTTRSPSRTGAAGTTASPTTRTNTTPPRYVTTYQATHTSPYQSRYRR